MLFAWLIAEEILLRAGSLIRGDDKSQGTVLGLHRAGPAPGAVLARSGAIGYRGDGQRGKVRRIVHMHRVGVS